MVVAVRTVRSLVRAVGVVLGECRLTAVQYTGGLTHTSAAFRTLPPPGPQYQAQFQASRKGRQRNVIWMSCSISHAKKDGSDCTFATENFA